MRKGRLRANVSAVWLYCSCCSAPVLYNQLSGWPILCRLQPSIRMNLGSSCVCAEFFFLSAGTFWDPTGSTASKRSSDGSHLTRIKYILKQKIKCSGCQRHGSVWVFAKHKSAAEWWPAWHLCMLRMYHSYKISQPVSLVLFCSTSLQIHSMIEEFNTNVKWSKINVS